MTRAENFRMVDIEINSWASIYLKIETNLILYLYPEKHDLGTVLFKILNLLHKIVMYNLEI